MLKWFFIYPTCRKCITSKHRDRYVTGFQRQLFLDRLFHRKKNIHWILCWWTWCESFFHDSIDQLSRSERWYKCKEKGELLEGSGRCVGSYFMSDIISITGTKVRFLLIFRGMGVRFYFFSCRYCVSFHRLEILGEQGYIFLLYSEFHRFSLWYQLWTCRATCKHALGTQERWNKSIFLDMKDNEPLSSGLSIGSLCFGGFWAENFDAPVWLWAYIASPGPLSWVKMRTVVAHSDWDGDQCE